MELRKHFNVHVIKIIAVLMFVLCVCISSAICLTFGIKALSASADSQTKNLILDNFDYLCELERDYRNRKPDASAEDVAAFLEDKIAGLTCDGNGISMLNYSTNDDSSYHIWGHTVSSTVAPR